MVSIGSFSLTEFLFCLLNALYLCCVVVLFFYARCVRGLQRSVLDLLFAFAIPIGVIQAVRSIDLHGYHGTWSLPVVLLLGDNVTMLQILCLVCLIHNFMSSTLGMLERLDIESSKLRQRFGRISKVSLCSNLLMVVILNSVNASMFVRRDAVARSILFICLSVNYIITAVSISLACGYLRSTQSRFRRMLSHKPNIGSILASQSTFDMPEISASPITDLYTPLLSSIFSVDISSETVLMPRKRIPPTNNYQTDTASANMDISANIAITPHSAPTFPMSMPSQAASSLISGESPRHTMVLTPTHVSGTPTAISITNMVQPDELDDDMLRMPSNPNLVTPDVTLLTSPELEYEDSSVHSVYSIAPEEGHTPTHLLRERQLEAQNASQQENITKTLNSITQLQRSLYVLQVCCLCIFFLALGLSVFTSIFIYLHRRNNLKHTHNFFTEGILSFVQLFASYILLSVIIAIYRFISKHTIKL